MFGMDGETHPNRIWVEKKCVFRRTFKSKQRDSAHTHTQYKHKIGNEGKTTKIDNLFDCPRLIVSRSILQNPFSFPWQAMLFLSLAPMDVVAVNCVSSSAAKCRQAGRQAVIVSRPTRRFRSRIMFLSFASTKCYYKIMIW